QRRLGSLAAGESRSYRCTLAGVHESFRHLASVTARSPAGVRVNANAPIAVLVRVVRKLAPERPALLGVKDPDLQRVAPGSDAPFVVVVRNVGNVTLHDVKLIDLPTPDCSRTIGTLAVGGTARYSCRAVNVTKDFTNRIRATGVSPRGLTAVARDYV